MIKRVHSLVSMTVSILAIASLFLVLDFKTTYAQEDILWSEKYDASAGVLHNLTIENSFSGYTGGGYVAGWNEDNQYVDIEIDVPADGNYSIEFRYSAAAGDSIRYLRIGDSFELDKLTFRETNDWDDWSTTLVKDVYLTKGVHLVSLIFDASKESDNWINYDQLIVSEQGSEKDYDWNVLDERAQQAQDSLYENFWNNSLKMFNNAYECNYCNGQFHYWWQAHAIDALIDGYERTRDDEYIERASEMYNGIIQRNGGITNHFYDDMLWMGLALLRLYEHTNDEVHKDAVYTLWTDIKTGWNDEAGGGIAWNKGQLDYKNSPSNAPAVILAARLYETFGNADDLEWAHKIYDWQKSTLVDQETGFVWDGINREGNGNIDKDWAFTYNQGVYIGASLELYKITGELNYREAALQTAETTIDRFADQNGIIFESDSGDGGLFKGILIRYLTDVVLQDPSQKELADLIIKNANSAWDQTESEAEILFGSSWLNQPDTIVELSQQLSGLMLMEHASVLRQVFVESSPVITGVKELEDIYIEVGEGDLNLPSEIEVITSDGQKHIAIIEWDDSSKKDYNANEPGEYIFLGYINLDSIDATNPDDFMAIQKVVVEALDEPNDHGSKEITIDDNPKQVEPGVIIDIVDTNASIKLPDDLPIGTKLQVKSVSDIISPGLTQAGEAFEFILTFPEGYSYEDIQADFMITLGVDDDVDEKNAAIYYYNYETNEWEYIDGKLEEGKVTVTMGHLSKFGVFVQDDQVPVENENEENGGDNSVEKNPNTENDENQQSNGKSTENSKNEDKENKVEQPINQEKIKGDRLPATATQHYNKMLFGLILILFASIVWKFSKTRQN